MKSIFKHLILALIAMSFISTPAIAAQCDTNNARNTEIWKLFNQQLIRDYDINNLGNPRAIDLAIGHAMGRVATAVNGALEREVAFACLDKAIQQTDAQMRLSGMGSYNYSLMKEAMMGYHNDEVERWTGIRGQQPYYDFMDRAFSRSTGNSMRSSTFGIGPASPPAPSQPQGWGNNTVTDSWSNWDSYSNKQCLDGNGYSANRAADMFRDVVRMQRAFNSRYGDNATCSGDHWYECSQIATKLAEAGRELIHVLDANVGVNRCRKCNFDSLYEQSSPLPAWQKWLRDRYYGSQSGLSNPREIIGQHMSNPVCKTTGEDYYTPLPPAPSAPAPVSSGATKPGYYVFKKTGSGFTKKFGGSAYSFTGHQYGVVQFKEGDSVTNSISRWIKKEAENTEKACKAGASVHGSRDPEIWVNGPSYAMVDGPYTSFSDAAKKYKCGRADGSVVCYAWNQKTVKYSEAQAACGRL